MRRIKDLTLVGGYNLKEPWARGSYGMDWRTLTLRMTGQVSEPYYDNTVLTYDLANAEPMESFPEVQPTNRVWGWWPTEKAGGAKQYANGLWFDGTKWWAACRAHYDLHPRGDMDVYGSDGTVWNVPLAQQRFSGFVKPPPDADLISWAYFGCGGYESGQGTCSGPTLADYLGNVYLEYDWLPDPGVDLEHWDTRAPRLPDYSVGSDTWLGWMTRQVADVVQGRWASDWLYGGGVILPDGPLCYFPYQGTGELHYDWGGNPNGFDQRTITFAEGEWANRSSLLAYDPATFECVEFDRVFDFRGPVCGQEVDPQGRLWLAERGGHGDAEIQIRVYQVTYDE